VNDPNGPPPFTLSDDDLVRINRWVLVASVVRGTVHSVNNILQSIGGQAELLSQRAGDPEDVMRRAERIIAQTGRAAGYMRELSGVGREVVDAPDRADLRQAVDRAFALREYDMLRARIAFEVVTESETVPTVRIDYPALSMILLNLLLNAEQALAGVADARISVVLGVAGSRGLISVRDNGPGIPPELRARVFEPFFTTGRSGATLGVGLAVARRLAGQHGGLVDVIDDPRTRGARVDVEIPLV
jgi:signal transduction histidine kinase